MKNDKPVKSRISKKKEFTIREGFYSNLISIVFISILVFILYGNTFINRTELKESIVTSEVLQNGINGIPEIIFEYEPFYEINMVYSYQPIAKITYALEYELFSGNIIISLFINLMLFLFIGIVLFIFLRKVFKNFNFLFALVVTLLFVAHPLHCEVVNDLLSRGVILGFLFSIISAYFIFLYEYSNQKLFIIAAVLFFIIALLSDSVSLVFIVIIPFAIYLFTKASDKRLVFYFLVTIVLLFIPIIASKVFVNDDELVNNIIDEGLFSDALSKGRIVTGLITFLFYLKLLIIPDALLFNFSFDQFALSGIGNFLILISSLLIISLFVYAFLKKRKDPIMTFGLIMIFVGLLPYLNWFYFVPGIFTEQLAFAAVLGFCICFSSLIFKILKINLSVHIKSLKMNASILIVVFVILTLYGFMHFR